MREIEVKILEIDKEAISDKILNLGGEQTDERVIVDNFYDYPDGRLKKIHEVLRVRNSEKEKEIVYKCAKEKNDEFKIHREIETSLGSPETMMEILEKCGLVIVRHTEKKRTSFEFENVKIEIDEYPDIPPFIEIEGPDEESIRTAVEKLGYQMKDTTSVTGHQVIRKYGKDPANVRF
ncbi:MAG: class IV adenylate cyclase [Candidatus Aenigmarchaeota archaeon]|nr:class IV adenylate cyclase [Candidatus Aenigmarchaeota archaeon]